MLAKIIGSSVYTLVVSVLCSEVDSLSRVCSIYPGNILLYNVRAMIINFKKKSKKITQPLLDMEEAAGRGFGRCFSFDSSAKFVPKFVSKILM